MLSNSTSFIAPTWLDVDTTGLRLESTVGHLRLCQFQVDAETLGLEVMPWFEQDALCPGVLLLAQDKFLGMLSRRRILEYLIRPQGQELFLKQPLHVLYSYARTPIIRVARHTSILKVARQALRRSPELQGEPIVIVDDHTGYYLLDSHELNIAYWQIRGLETQVRYERVQAQMIQNDKMASLGRLVDGVAHEILDPVGFIWGNLTHITTYSEQLLELLAAYEAAYPQPPPAIATLQTEIEIDYLRQDVPRTIQSIRSGADRLRKLASSLQTFCHIDDVYPKPADLHECLDSIVVLLKERLSGEIQIQRDYGRLPPVSCFVGQLSQVFMTILVNAVDVLMHQAVAQAVGSEFAVSKPLAFLTETPAKPQITITTEVKPGSAVPDIPHVTRWASIHIADNGPGLSDTKQRQISESFVVEKRPARETSLGLSHHIITAKHGGQLHLRSPWVDASGNTCVGTEFEILLPIA